MNMRLYQAVIQHLRGEALQAAGMIESILKNPPTTGENATELIAQQCLKLVQYEGALHSFQTYFALAPQPPPAVSPSPRDVRPTPAERAAATPPLVVTPEMSSTMRESLKMQFEGSATDSSLPHHQEEGEAAEEDDRPDSLDESPDWYDDE